MSPQVYGDTYQVHYDEDNRQYWIGFVVRYPNGSPAFIQQAGNYYQSKKVAERVAQRMNKNA